MPHLLIFWLMMVGYLSGNPFHAGVMLEPPGITKSVLSRVEHGTSKTPVLSTAPAAGLLALYDGATGEKLGQQLCDVSVFF